MSNLQNSKTNMECNGLKNVIFEMQTAKTFGYLLASSQTFVISNFQIKKRYKNFPMQKKLFKNAWTKFDQFFERSFLDDFFHMGRIKEVFPYYIYLKQSIIVILDENFQKK